MPAIPLSFDVPPFRLSGVVYSALLNDPAQIAALGEAVHQPPYKAPPAAPVLALRPRNSLVADGSPVGVPAGTDALEIGASLGIVIGRVACRVPAHAALDWVAGYVIATEFSVPTASHYRPAVRQKARDGFCPLGPRVVPAARVTSPDDLAVSVQVDGISVWQGRTGPRQRGVAQLIADVTDFMTLQPGDVLLLGAAGSAPKARAGQQVAVSIDGLGTLHNPLVEEVA